VLGPDAAVIDRQFRRSGLMRPKWDERHGDRTYGERTIARALERFAPEGASGSRPQVVLHSAWVADVASERIDWLWLGWLALGKLAVIEGDPGLGKSTLTMDLAARVSRGQALPGVEELAPPSPPHPVLVASAEDSTAQTIRPRLEAAGADLTRVRVLSHVTVEATAGVTPRAIFLPNDLPLIEPQMVADGTKLLIVDPLMAFLGNDSFGRAIDANKDQSVRLLLGELARLAERTGAAVLLVRHLNKSPSSSAIQRGGGSIGITGAARAVLLVGRDPDEPTGRVLAMTKCNLGARPLSRRFRVVSGESSAGPAARLEWGAETELTCDDILKVPDKPAKASARDTAKEWLKQVLVGGPLPQTEVEARAGAEGISAATLKRAKEELGVRSRKSGRPAVWYWELDLPVLDPLEPLS
jgi:hypothetical protein